MPVERASEVIRMGRLTPPPIGNFKQQYLSARGFQEKLAILKSHYPIPGIEVTAESKSGFISLKGIGRLEIDGKNKYRIVLMGVMSHPEHEAYLLFHEYMHVWLRENGLSFSHEGYDEVVSAFLFMLKNLIEDYIIEKETRRQFGDHFEWVCGDLRDYDLTGQFQGLADGTVRNDYFKIFMLALTCKVTVDLYPALSHTKSSQLFGDGISISSWAELQPMFERLSTENPFAYKGCVTSILRGITDSGAHFDNGNLVVEDIHAVNGAIKEIDQMISQIAFQLQMVTAIRRR